MDGTQLLTYTGFILSTLMNLCNIRAGKPLSPIWLGANGVLAVLALTDFYLNRIEGYILPASFIDPDYKVNKVKSLLKVKTNLDPQSDTAYKNGKELKRSHFTRLDYIAEKLDLSTSKRITRHLAIFPVKSNKGFIWLRLYYAFSVDGFGPGLHDGTSYHTKLRTTNLSELAAFISEYKIHRRHG